VSDSGDRTYGGDISVEEAWSSLRSDPAAVLIDVRTEAEWTFVGVPDLSSIDKQTLLVSWNTFPPNQPQTDFIERLDAALGAQSIGKDAPLFFLCRSGQRSQSAAIVATQAGYAGCFNVVEGFEGPLGPERHRGTKGSWKAEGLPWKQS